MASPSLAARVLTGTTARASYAAATYAATPVPTARELHVLNRMGCGFTPAGLRELRAAGSPAAWFERQLAPASITDTTRANAVRTWFPELVNRTPAQKWTSNRTGGRQGWEYARDLSNYSLLKRIYSRRTVLESMTLFWTDHFHVHGEHFPAFTQRAAYDATIRTHALGRFEDLLVACALHPAMLLYLDNFKSVRNAPNENQGRELLELHTVGREAGYTEQMVKDSATILSGWTVEWDTFVGYYSTGRHTTGPVSVLGFSRSNASDDGRQLTRDYLRHLARHPATAQRICRKLATRFVSDHPSQALVDSLAATYRSSGTDISAVLRKLVRSDEFWASAGKKVRTPVDDLVHTYRVLGARVEKPVDLESCAHTLSWQLNSTLVAQWPTPAGPPERAQDWASPSRMLNSFDMHWSVAAGWWPRNQVTHRTAASWLPKSSIRFDQLVDHLSRVVLGRRSTNRLLQACVEATGISPSQVITKDHGLVRWGMYRLLGVLLDSPAHMTR
ncbi:DUF1800 domain-containing protein [Nocardioides marmoribigeumensis]|uniref:Uncharacterized protein (DUF1800 family) n=1 Tax=Nocardioides marmoribigeumensis TaxID=433649 RepID=A0ABU2BTY3_9ACTN|nr:DUF1800 domain-containing protein [Nocardioides marmoribigeumensis]MDR7362094.1 uncharacterized protein (DUF1800 family) [Nocardioides marmoribigeumensis]